MERIKQRMYEARKQRQQIQQGYDSSADAMSARNHIPVKDSIAVLISNKTRLLLVAILIITSTILIWWLISSNEHPVERFSGTDNHESWQAIDAVGTTVDIMNRKIALLTTQMDTLSESIAQLDARLISTQKTLDAVTVAKAQPTKPGSEKQETIPKAVKQPDTPPASAPEESGMETRTAEVPQPSSARVAPEASTRPARLESQRSGEHEHSTIKMDRNGPWVINLVSTSSKTDADRLSKKAHSRNIPTEQQTIIVKGTQYWRVQVTGFTTADDARAYAETAKAQLGLKDAWIMKR